MTTNIENKDIVSIEELGPATTQWVTQLKGATNQADSRLILVRQGQPVAVIQDYQAYQTLLLSLAETEKALHIAQIRERLRQMNDGQMATVPFNQIVAQQLMPLSGTQNDVSS